MSNYTPFRVPPEACIRIPVTSRPPSSDTDSEYGARSKKKKKPRVSGDELRTSSRGVKVPNYADDVEDFEQFDEPHPGYYIDPNAQEKENDEIELVLGHSREEGHEEDPEDLWYENLVSIGLISFLHMFEANVFSALPYQMEGILPFAEH
jgi:chromodomain-helicase-DNA-binding protein 1